MSPRNIGVVYRKELVDSLRDRRTITSMVVVPILLMPLLTIGLGFFSLELVRSARKETPRIMVLGGQDSPKIVAQLRRLKSVEIVPAKSDYAAEITNRMIRAAVEIPAGFDAKLERGEAASVTIYLYEGEIKSAFAAATLRRFFEKLRQTTVEERLTARHLPATLVKPFEIAEKNVAPPEKVSGTMFGGLVPYFVIVLCLTGAIYPAIDLTAGEKERGTMETILCSPVSRTDLVLGKFLMVLTASLATAVLAILSMGVSLLFAKQAMAGIAGQEAEVFHVAISAKAVAAVFAMVLPIAVLFSAALLAIALFAKSFREAQSYLSPLTIVVILPAVVSLLPGVELNTKLALVPILNTSLVSKEIVAGTYHWKYIFLIFASSCVYAALALAAAVHMFNREDVLFRT